MFIFSLFCDLRFNEMQRGRGGRGGGRGGISWIKKEEPKFIRQFKERIAYKEQASVETKVLNYWFLLNYNFFIK